MEFRKKIWYVTGIALGIVAIGAIGYGGYRFYEYQTAVNSLSNDELKGWYNRAREIDKELESTVNFELVNSAGFNWKSLGDATGKPYFYRKALRDYALAQRYEQSKSALFFLNSGNIYKSLKEYQKADDQYIQAVAIEPGNDANVMARIGLWQIWPEKSSDDVLDLFDQALAMLLDSANVTLAKAEYLDRIGRFEEALRIYEALKITVTTKGGVVDAIDQKIRLLKKKIDAARIQ